MTFSRRAFLPSHHRQLIDNTRVLLVTRCRPSQGQFESHQGAIVQIASVACPRTHRFKAPRADARNWEKEQCQEDRNLAKGAAVASAARPTRKPHCEMPHTPLLPNPQISPLEFLLGIMRDPDAPDELRMKAAQATLPFVHARPVRARPDDPPGSAKLIDAAGAFTVADAVAKALRDDYQRLGELVRKKCSDALSAAEVEEELRLRARIEDRAGAIGCPAGYGLKQAQKDSNRLHELYCKRISPPSYGGGALSEAQDAEEAQLRARLAAFEESPEGCARRRIRDLEMQDFGAGRSPAEQSELETLRTLYPDLPLDSDDPLTEAFEAWRRVAAEGSAAASSLDKSKSPATMLSVAARPIRHDDEP